jgi:hypothetical protein
MRIGVSPGREPGSYRVELDGLTFEAAFARRAAGRHEADLTVYRGDAVLHRDRVDLARVEARGAFAATLKAKSAVDDGIGAEDLERVLLALGEKDRRTPRARARSSIGGLSLELVAPDGIPPDLAAVVRELRLPAPYRLDEGVLLGADGITITTTPVLPVFEVDDVDLGSRLLACLILLRGQWRLETLPRGELLDRKRIIGRLAGLGVDVASGSESLLIAFLQAYLRANGDRLALRRRTGRLGFHRVDDRPVCVLWQVHTGSIGIGDLAFNTENEEARARHAALEPRGTLVGWTACIELVLEFPIVVFTMLMALVPALRELLGLLMKSCIVYLLERSTTGKTAAQEIACSVWAQPGEAWIKSAHGTYKGIEDLLLSTCGLPVFLEDAHLLPEEIVKLVIYAVANEHFKARGGERRRPQAHWRGLPIVSGELAIVHGGSLPGAVVRVMTIRGLPFGEQSEERGRFVKEISDAVRAHYGHLGPALVQKLLGATPAERAALVGEWERAERAYATAAGGHALLARQAPQYAAAALAAKLVAELTGLAAAKLVAAVDTVFERARAQAIVPSPARRAAELLISEIESHRHACAVWDTGEAKYKQPLGARQFGVINEEEEFAAIFVSIAHEALQRHDLQLHQILEAMRDLSLLLPDRKTGFTAQVWHLNHRPRMYKFPYPLPPDAGDTDEAS